MCACTAATGRRRSWASGASSLPRGGVIDRYIEQAARMQARGVLAARTLLQRGCGSR